MELLYSFTAPGDVAYLDGEHIEEHWNHERHLVLPESLSSENLSIAYHQQFTEEMGNWLMRHGGISRNRTSDGLLTPAYEPIEPFDHHGRMIFAGVEWYRQIYMVGAAPCLLGLAVTIEPLLNRGEIFGGFAQKNLRLAANHLFDAMQWRGFNLREKVSDVGTVVRMKAIRRSVA